MTKMHYAGGNDPDMFYRVRKDISDPFFLVIDGGAARVFLNVLELGAFREQAGNIEAVPLEPFVAEARRDGGAAAGAVALAILRRYRLAEQPIEVAASFPLDVADYLRARGVTLVVKKPFVPERARKSPSEAESIRESLRRTGTAFKLIEDVLRAAVVSGDTLVYEGAVLTSESLREKAELALFKEGLESSEGLIISSGPDTALPHHKGSGPVKAHTPIVCDLFPRDRTTRYFADMTRTYVKGAPSERLEKMYAAVARAQDAAIELIRPGAKAKDVHNAAAKVLEEAGFSGGFIHGLGHGLGLEIHEAPRLGPASTDILEEENVVTVEPGLYFKEEGGVRLEDVVLVTKDGCENLTDYGRTLVVP